MMRIPMSKPASALFRALLARGGVSRDRILLTAYRSTEWQSLTFVGESHRLGFRVPAPDAGAVTLRMIEGIEDAEFTIPGHFVADIGVTSSPRQEDDGSITFELEALTIAE
jgi:hypothetical protein